MSKKYKVRCLRCMGMTEIECAAVDNVMTKRPCAMCKDRTIHHFTDITAISLKELMKQQAAEEQKRQRVPSNVTPMIHRHD